MILIPSKDRKARPRLYLMGGYIMANEFIEKMAARLVPQKLVFEIALGICFIDPEKPEIPLLKARTRAQFSLARYCFGYTLIPDSY